MATDVTAVSLLIILAVFAVALNCFCLVVLGIAPILRKPSRYTIGSLLFIHFLQGVFVIPMYAAKRWDIKDINVKGITCDIFRFSYLLTNYASLLILVIIGIDRTCSISFPLKYHFMITPRRMAIALVVVWLYITSLCALPFQNGTSKSGCSYVPSKEWTTAMLLSNTLIPFIVLAVCYLYIYYKTKQVLSKRISTVLNTSTVHDQIKDTGRKSSKGQKNEMLATRMSCIIVIVYFFCWGPSFFYYLLLSLCQPCFPDSYFDSSAENTVNLLVKVLTFIDAIAAPIIYCWKHRGFRKTVIRYVGKRSAKVDIFRGDHEMKKSQVVR